MRLDITGGAGLAITKNKHSVLLVEELKFRTQTNIALMLALPKVLLYDFTSVSLSVLRYKMEITVPIL